MAIDENHPGSSRTGRIGTPQEDVAIHFLPPYENPIQRPPHATPNHRTNDMSAVTRPCTGRSEVRSICVTRRRTVNVKRSTRNSDVIFTQKAKLYRHLIDSERNRGTPDANIKVTLPSNHGCVFAHSCAALCLRR